MENEYNYLSNDNRPTVQLGDQNDYVYELQKDLVKLEFLRGEPNGIFGINTERAVRLFQLAYNLPVTGIVDNEVWNEIEIALESPFPSTRPTLKLGDQSLSVRSLEQRLIVLGFLYEPAGDLFDEETEEAVKIFQISRGLEPDGIVGPRTWRELDQSFAAVGVNVPTIKPTVQERDQNDYVELLQSMLTAFGYYRGNVDGIFGRNTTNAVITLQETYGLEPTGIVDYFTWEVLDSKLNPTFIYIPILKEGSTVPEVAILQEKLKIAGFFPGTVTGSFGPETTTALEEFQRTNNLPATGITDRETWRELFRQTAIITSEIFPLIPVGSRPTLRYGDQGGYVEELQRDLKQLMFYDGEINGNFDTKTLNSVKAFQTNNKLTADGIVGRQTWSALIYLYSPLAICGGVTPEPPEYFIHTVQRGDSLWAIANRFGTTVDEIKRLNNLTSDLLSIGQQLRIPGTSTVPPEYFIYTVQRGDSLWAIANRFGTTVAEIKRLNNLTSDLLNIGQQLRIPGTSTVPPEYFIYTVQRGDSLWAIASRFGTTVDEIKRLNNLTSNLLSIGQQLRIPQ